MAATLYDNSVYLEDRAFIWDPAFIRTLASKPRLY